MSNETLPPKTGSVDKLVTIQEDVRRVLEGTKTATRRNGRCADVGERFELQGKTFEVTKVFQQSLGELTDADAKSEGFDNLEAYKSNILSMHPGMPWMPQMKVWTHEFRPVG